MLAKSKAYSGFAVKDIEQAKRFYGETLGLDVSAENGLLTIRLPEGRNTLVYEKPDFEPATYTILNFPVKDVEAEVDELTERGVRFERYDDFEQDDKGIARFEGGPTIAWFTDPEGNILAVHDE
jgi:predicted enzyme related to lactoylglutathione lyase